MRKICYISGTRADFGLMKSTLDILHADDSIELKIIATGMHLSKTHGMTINEIKEAGFSISHIVELEMEPYTGSTMAKNIGHMLIGFVDALGEINPDLVLLLGDRGEMLAGGLAAIHLNIHVAHIHGGERSGTVDEPVRHCISKLSHFHFTATEKARNRLIRMGEFPESIWSTGAPGLDNINNIKILKRPELAKKVGLDRDRPIALFIYHPVLQEFGNVGESTKYIIDTLVSYGIQVVALMPNSDAGSQPIRDELRKRKLQPEVSVITHLDRLIFLSWMESADFMIGNSSAGIIEAASFGTPVINIGSRQNLRERNENVLDVINLENELHLVIEKIIKRGRFDKKNIYGDGMAGVKIVNLLKNISLSRETLFKTNAY